jgi:hypothetical protein
MYLVYYQDYENVRFGKVFGTLTEAIHQFIKDECNEILELEVGKEARYIYVTLDMLKQAMPNEELDQYIVNLEKDMESRCKDQEYREMIRKKEAAYFRNDSTN